jgi:integrase
MSRALCVKSATVSMQVLYHYLEATGEGKARRYPRATAAALLDRADRGAGAKIINLFTNIRHTRPRLLGGRVDPYPRRRPGQPQGIRGLKGRERHALYLAAMSTGFRASELAALRPRSFDLVAVPVVVTFRAEHTKNKRPVVHPSLPMSSWPWPNSSGPAGRCARQAR